MARTQKTPRYNEFNKFENCFGIKQVGLRDWQNYLKQQPLTIELGCGKAEVSLELAAQNPEKNYIGIDLKADRMWRAAKNAKERGLKNIAFIQTDILNISEYIDDASVEELWITFPDPHPKKRDAKHRMTGASFLKLYKKLLVPGGAINFKTDDPDLFTWSLESFVTTGLTINDLTFDLYEHDCREEAKIITTFEKRWLKEGKKVHYARVQ